MRGDSFGNVVNYNSGIRMAQGGHNVGSDNSLDTTRVSPDPESATPLGDRARNVFVVFGRDEQVRKAVFTFLRELGLRPLEWESVIQATGVSAPSIRDVVAQVLALAQAALILLTPDDVVSLHPALRYEREPSFEIHPSLQPRPNVLIELGMALMAFDERTVIVEFGGLRPIGDLQGRNVIRFGDPAVSLVKIVSRLKLAGCAVDDTGSDWRDIRSFAQLAALERGI